MPNWIVVGLVGLAFALVATWVVRRLLDSEVGWLRSAVTALVVFALGLPFLLWSLSDVVVDGQFVAPSAAVLALTALILGWMIAVVVIAMLTMEFLWPSRGFQNPITVVRDTLRRRDRARRYAQILLIGSRHGLTFYEGRRRGDSDLPRALVSAMNEAGVTFVKLGQVLSSREDLLPRDLVDAFATLQMDSTPIPWAEAEAAILEQLGQPIAEVFSQIDPEPLAAASVAQVHAARLVSGQDVVVKIQRPRARAQVTTDLDILERLALEAERRTSWAREYGTRALAAEFSRALRDELDYRIEVSNTEMVRGAVSKSPSILRIPAVYREYSTAQMLVQERAMGTPFSRIEPGSIPLEQATAIADAILEALFEHIALRGVFHADLHPGNVMLNLDEGTVTLIDFGSVGVVERSIRRLLLPLLIGMANDDDVAVTDTVLLLCAPPESDTFDAAALQHEIGVVLTRVHNSKLEDNIFRLLVDVLRRNRLALPPSLLLVLRTLTSVEGTLRRLVPDYDMVGRALEVAPKLALKVYTPKELALSAQTWAALVSEQVHRLPRRIESITRSLDEGTLSVRLRTFESADERGWVDGILGRITTTLVGIALVLSSVTLAVANSGPTFASGVPVFVVLGSATGLGGLLLIARSLRAALRRRGR
ncbi:MAG: hypothetical protein KKH75_01145 [Actinobacteria bacterium]|nr:hypothetical protein [Actinomycetota bacterium]